MRDLPIAQRINLTKCRYLSTFETTLPIVWRIEIFAFWPESCFVLVWYVLTAMTGGCQRHKLLVRPSDVTETDWDYPWKLTRPLVASRLCSVRGLCQIHREKIRACASSLTLHYDTMSMRADRNPKVWRNNTFWSSLLHDWFLKFVFLQKVSEFIPRQRLVPASVTLVDHKRAMSTMLTT